MTDVNSAILDDILGDETILEASDNDLQTISVLAKRQRELEDKVLDLEGQLATEKEALRNIQEKALPDAMTSVGMVEFVMEDGYKVKVKDDVSAGIRAGMAESATEWLDKQGLGDIIKDDVIISFGKGERQQATDLMLRLLGDGLNATEKLNVHSQTLKATVKEQLEKGIEFPTELFNVYQYKKTVITAPRKKK